MPKVTVPFSLVIIKPMSVGRGDAPDILSAILVNCPVTLRMFRVWTLCRMTLVALEQHNVQTISLPGNTKPSWICLFTHVDRVTNPTSLLDDYFGNLNPIKVTPGSLRHRFGGFAKIGPTAHINDDAVHLAHESRADFEASALFMNFDADKV